LRTLGKVVEESVEKILVRHLGANAVRSEIKLVGPGGQRVIDSMLTLGNRISYLEVQVWASESGRSVRWPDWSGRCGLQPLRRKLWKARWCCSHGQRPVKAQMALVLAELGEGASAVRIISGLRTSRNI
jgi:hypothetical protein